MKALEFSDQTHFSTLHLYRRKQIPAWLGLMSKTIQNCRGFKFVISIYNIFYIIENPKRLKRRSPRNIYPIKSVF